MGILLPFRYADTAMTDRISHTAMREEFLAGSGPGGQNANKVATGVRLYVAVALLDLPAFARTRLRRIAGQRLNRQDELVITAREHRTREANREAARRRAEALIAKALQRPSHRKPTRPSRAAKQRRTDRKTQRGSVKKLRGKPRID